MSTESPVGSETDAWPRDVDLEQWYQAERAEVDETIKDAMDLSVWTLEARREATQVYVHCKNNEKLSYSVRSVTKVAGTVSNVLECLRSSWNEQFRTFQKALHPKNFIDGEVLHADMKHNYDLESMALKWSAFSSGKRLGRGKEFLVREYCSLLRSHSSYGTVGVCRFESYDGVGAKYNIRARPDTYSLTVFEPSSIVVQQTPEEGTAQVTLTISVRKARGESSVSPGVKLLALRLAKDMAHLQRAVQHALFQPSTLAGKKEWVSDGDRSNCSLCVQSFGMLKRRHHCRVCGEVVCASCTLFKVVKGKADGKVRVCKACLSKSSTSDPTAQSSVELEADQVPAMMPTRGANPRVAPMSMPNLMNSSVCSTNSSILSTGSDEPARSVDDLDSFNPCSVVLFKQSSLPSASTLSTSSKGSSVSLNELDLLTSTSSFSPRSVADHQGNNTSEGLGKLPHTTSYRSKSLRRVRYFNDDFEEICMLAMETLDCPMAGIRTEDFELVKYFEDHQSPKLPRSLPTFRRIASRGKPCIVLDVSADKRISGDKKYSAKFQFFVGIPLMINGEVVGDLCVADMYPRDTIEHSQIEVLKVLGETVSQYMSSADYLDDLAAFRTAQRKGSERCNDLSDHLDPMPIIKEVAF